MSLPEAPYGQGRSQRAPGDQDGEGRRGPGVFHAPRLRHPRERVYRGRGQDGHERLLDRPGEELRDGGEKHHCAWRHDAGCRTSRNERGADREQDVEERHGRAPDGKPPYLPYRERPTVDGQ